MIITIFTKKIPPWSSFGNCWYCNKSEKDEGGLIVFVEWVNEEDYTNKKTWQLHYPSFDFPIHS